MTLVAGAKAYRRKARATAESKRAGSRTRVSEQSERNVHIICPADVSPRCLPMVMT